MPRPTIPVKLAYDSFKPSFVTEKNRAPLIFLHGVTGSKENWNDVPKKLADQTKRLAYVLDGRNHGDSEWSDIMTIDSGVVDICHFMDTIQAPKAIIIGHSLGGITASRMALSKPERIEKLIMEDSSIRKFAAEETYSVLLYMNLWREAILNIPKGMTEPYITRFVVDYVYDKLNPSILGLSAKEHLYNCNFTMKKTADGTYDVKHNIDALKYALDNPDEVVSDPEGTYDGPAYFLYGDKSSMKVHEDEALIKNHFPKAKMIKFEKGLHNLHLEFPDKFLETLHKCIEE